MFKKITAFDYPIIIKQQLGFITVSCPDLNIVVAQELPQSGSINKEFLMRLAGSIGKTWIKINGEIAGSLKKKSPPKPSSTKQIFTVDRRKYITTPIAAKLLNLSENTVRRLVKKKILRSKNTPGGHRRILESDIERYLSMQTKTAANDY